MLAIIDYDAGNIKSVFKALEYLGEKAVVTRDPELLKKADKVILPGVGAFGDAMGRLHAYRLVEPIQEIAQSGTPFMGICLGLQLFFEESEEAEGVKGLSLLKGKIIKFPENQGLKVPHMGWNSLEIKKESRILKGIPENAYVYFVHSYYLQAARREDVAAGSEYILPFDAAVERDNLFATQFHPEKSGEIGLTILKNFCEI